MPAPYFIRVAVDLDLSLQPIGWHVELRDPDKSSHLALTVGTPGPFDTTAEAWDEALRFARDRWGSQARLW